MGFKMKDLWKTKYQQIILLSVVVNLGIMYFLGKLGEIGTDLIQTIIVFLGIAIVISKTITFKKAKPHNMFIIGVLMSIIYNGGGLYFGWFDITPSSLVLPALQQGVITFVTAKARGMK